MATTLERLITARDNLDARIVDLTGSLNPDHSEAGRSVQLSGYLDTLMRQRDLIDKLIQRAGGPAEVRTYGVCN